MRNVGPTRLCPLDILRRISAKVILNLFPIRFSKHLVPFNYTFGVNGGMEFIISTVCLGAEKYITKRQDEDLLPTRVLLSILRHKKHVQLHVQRESHIIAEDFPDLLLFFGMLYATRGQTIIKLEGGSWEIIDMDGN